MANRIRYFGWNRFCPICDRSVRQFLQFGLSGRPDVGCPLCGSAERHRLAWVVLKQCTDLLELPNRRLLHFAPEPCLRGKLQRMRGVDYATADLLDPSVNFTVDLTNLPWEDCSFDAIICLSVLQHVSDGSQALRELYRIVRPGGWALLTVPIFGDTTVEYGIDGFLPAQPTHGYPSDNSRRVFGSDFSNYVERVGFSVRTCFGAQLLDPHTLSRTRIPADEQPAFLCSKPA
jgi:SAM-dependent methyltransferase